MPDVSANPAAVEFPTDPWGFTRELRKAGLKAAAGVRGDEVKMKIFMDTVRTLVLHAQARTARDQAERDARYPVAAPVVETPAEPEVQVETPVEAEVEAEA